jgi:hypothetical protein
METKKMSLAKIQGKLSRAEMKNIMAGSGGLFCQGHNMVCNQSNQTCCTNQGLKCNTSTDAGACEYN